jgi:hypothetical protein
VLKPGVGIIVAQGDIFDQYFFNLNKFSSLILLIYIYILTQALSWFSWGRDLQNLHQIRIKKFANIFACDDTQRQLKNCKIICNAATDFCCCLRHQHDSGVHRFGFLNIFDVKAQRRRKICMPDIATTKSF